jgi:nicotinamide-nucleotide amidase
MAGGALTHSRANLAVAVTGIAGPDGGTAEKPVGLVYLAVASKVGATLTRECRFGSIGRTPIRLASVRAALELARQAVSAAARH